MSTDIDPITGRIQALMAECDDLMSAELGPDGYMSPRYTAISNAKWMLDVAACWLWAARLLPGKEDRG